MVVPIFKKVEISDRFASPTMTWRRRYLSWIGVRFVSRVDDGSLQRRLEANLRLEEVRPLRELVDALAAVVPLRLGADLAGPREHDAGDEERGDLHTSPNGVERSIR